MIVNSEQVVVLLASHKHTNPNSTARCYMNSQQVRVHYLLGLSLIGRKKGHSNIFLTGQPGLHHQMLKAKASCSSHHFTRCGHTPDDARIILLWYTRSKPALTSPHGREKLRASRRGVYPNTAGLQDNTSAARGQNDGSRRARFVGTERSTRKEGFCVIVSTPEVSRHVSL